MIIDAIFDFIFPLFQFLFVPSLGIVILATVTSCPFLYVKLNIKEELKGTIYTIIKILNYPASFIVSYVLLNEHIVRIVDKLILAMPPMTIVSAILQVPIIIVLYIPRFVIHIWIIPLIQKLSLKIIATIYNKNKQSTTHD